MCLILTVQRQIFHAYSGLETSPAAYIHYTEMRQNNEAMDFDITYRPSGEARNVTILVEYRDKTIQTNKSRDNTL